MPCTATDGLISFRWVVLDVILSSVWCGVVWEGPSLQSVLSLVLSSVYCPPVDLDLIYNPLQDAGVQLICASLRSRDFQLKRHKSVWNIMSAVLWIHPWYTVYNVIAHNNLEQWWNRVQILWLRSIITIFVVIVNVIIIVVMIPWWLSSFTSSPRQSRSYLLLHLLHPGYQVVDSSCSPLSPVIHPLPADRAEAIKPW